MNSLVKLAALADELDSIGLHHEAAKIDRILKSLAQEPAQTQSSAKTYFQRDPKTGTFRGILEIIGQNGAITFLPAKPLIGKNQAQLQVELAKLAPGLTVTTKGVGEPWLTEVNFPFDNNGKRVNI